MAKEKAFWKKKQSDQEASISQHIGKLIDRLTVDDMLMLALGLAGGISTKNWEGVIAGMLGYKLATTDGIVSQAAGLATLGTIGYVGLVNTGFFTGEERLRLEPFRPSYSCPPKYDLRWSLLGGWQCVPLEPGLPHVEPSENSENL